MEPPHTVNQTLDLSTALEMRRAVENACLRYLSRREYGRNELRQKLLAKGFPEELVSEVLADMTQEGLQSDARFAESLTRSRVAKGYGAYRIKQELRQRGIEDENEPDLKDIDWDSVIEKVHAKRFGNTLPASLPELATREQFLARRGFARDQIRRLFRRLRQGADE
jgi:regulatory protein